MTAGHYPRRAIGDFSPGFASSHSFDVSVEELAQFSELSGDLHPLHQDRDFSRERGYPDVLVHGMLIASKCSAFVARDFVGSGGLLISFAGDFRRPVYCGEGLVWRGEVVKVAIEDGVLDIRWHVINERGMITLRGAACAWLPSH